jgi:peptide/nickel transport system substrate-binding protein
MTADDLIFTFENLRDDKTHFPDSVANSWRQYIGELKKIDDYQFTLNLKAPMPEFWYQIEQSNLEVLPKATYLKMGFDEYFKKPVGTGPYVVESWDQANSTIKLTLRTDKNGYWGYRYTNRYTNAKNITIKYSPEAQTRLASLRSKEVQMIDTISAADKAVLDKEGFTTKAMPPVNAVFLQTASAKGDILENQKLREALSLCIDRKLLVDSLLAGYGIPITWPAAKGTLGYQDKVAIKYDKEKAKQLVKESGYDGKEINFIYTTSTVNIGTELTQAIQSMAAEVGIKLKITPLENAVYNDARTNHKFDLCLAAIAISGNAWIKIGKDVIGADRFNTGFQNTTLKDLGKKLGVTVDQAAADKLYQQIWDIETTEFTPNIYLYWPTIVNAWDAKVTGMLFHGNQYPDLSGLVIKD